MRDHSDIETAPVQSSRTDVAACPDRAPLNPSQTGQGTFVARLCALPEARMFGACVLIWLIYAAFLLMLAI